MTSKFPYKRRKRLEYNKLIQRIEKQNFEKYFKTISKMGLENFDKKYYLMFDSLGNIILKENSKTKSSFQLKNRSSIVKYLISIIYLFRLCVNERDKEFLSGI
jgi:hypothetical protein